MFLAVQPTPLSRIVLGFRSVSSGRYQRLRSVFGFLCRRFSSLLGCDLARQSQTCHLRTDPLGHQRIGKLLKWFRLGSGHSGSTLVETLEIMIVISVQPTNRGWLLRSPEFPLDAAMLSERPPLPIVLRSAASSFCYSRPNPQASKRRAMIFG